MLEDIKKDAADRMAKCVAALRNELKKLRTAARARACSSTCASTTTAARCRSRRSERRGRGLAHAHGGAVGEADGAVIEKAIMKSTGLNRRRRHGDPRALPRSRGAAPRAFQGRAPRRRGARVAIRNVRRDVMHELKEMLKEKLVSETWTARPGRGAEAHRQVRAEVDHVIAEKEKELMQSEPCESHTREPGTPRHVASSWTAMAAGPRGARCRATRHRAGSRPCARRGRLRAARVEALTLFAFSSENWAGPPRITRLMELFVEAMEREVDELARNASASGHRDLAKLKRTCATPSRSRGPHRGQHPHDRVRRGVLRRPLDIVALRDGLRPLRPRGDDPSAIDEQAFARELALGTRRSRTSSSAPRRAAHQQLPALEPRLHRTLLLRLPVAGLR